MAAATSSTGSGDLSAAESGRLSLYRAEPDRKRVVCNQPARLRNVLSEARISGELLAKIVV